MIQAFLLPPGLQLLFFLLGVLCLLASRSLARMFFFFAVVSLYLFSIPLVAAMLLQPLQQAKVLDLNNLSADGQAIVVLGAGKVFAPEYAGEDVSPTSWSRTRYAALLSKYMNKPIIAVGGAVPEQVVPVASLMENVLQKDFHLKNIWIEPISENTFANALQTKQLLQRYKMEQFYLVTSSWHMPRALWSFRQVGYDPIPAPTDFRLAKPEVAQITSWLPSAQALLVSNLALHEYVGLVWYHFRYQQSQEKVLNS